MVQSEENLHVGRSCWWGWSGSVVVWRWPFCHHQVVPYPPTGTCPTNTKTVEKIKYNYFIIRRNWYNWVGDCIEGIGSQVLHWCLVQEKIKVRWPWCTSESVSRGRTRSRSPATASSVPEAAASRTCPWPACWSRPWRSGASYPRSGRTHPWFSSPRDSLWCPVHCWRKSTTENTTVYSMLL